MDKIEKDLIFEVKKLSTNLTKDEVMVCYFNMDKIYGDELQQMFEKIIKQFPPNIPLLFMDKNFELDIETKENMINFLKGENNE